MPPRLAVSTALLAIGLLPLGLHAQSGGAQNGDKAWDPQEILRAETFVKPPANVERMVMAPRTDISFAMPSPDRTWFLRPSGADRGDIMAYGKPHIYLGGVVIDTKANRARSLTTSTRRGLSLMNPQTGASRTISTPAGASISAPMWSPTGTHVAYIANFDDASYAYVADVASGRSSRLGSVPLLATLSTSLVFTANGRSVLAVIVPEGRGAEPVRGVKGVADGPQVRLTGSRAVPQPVHFSLLEDPFDKARLKYYTTGQLALLDIGGKAVRRIGLPRMIRSFEPSSDAGHFTVTSMTEPFSYLVPVSSFGTVKELWDATGKTIATIETTPLRESGRGDVAAPGAAGAAASPDTGKRNVAWNPAGPGLVYMQSVFAGARAARPTPTSVRYVNWLPPFGPNDTKVLYEGSGQFTSLAYSDDFSTMFVADSGAVIAVRVADPARRFRLPRGITLAAGGGGFGGAGGAGGRGGRPAGDTLSPGGPLTMERGLNGQMLVTLGSDGRSVMVAGTRTPGANWHTQAPRPWVDRIDIETGARARIFDSPADAYEEFVTALDDDGRKYIVTRESPTVIADAWLRDATTGASKQLTHAVDVGPEISSAIVKRLQVTRPRDGAKIWTDVTLPRDWKPGTKLPGIIWFYPREYTSAADYEQSRYAVNINQFPDVPSARPASAVKLWVAQGYALIEPDIPIFGDSGRMNDNYTRDLKENLDAVLDAVVEAGYVDREKMGIGGHSYGAFSTVNAMTLVPYFKAGIAGDGMYNRTLTPFGFQSERRNFFQAQDTYLDMSPFLRADKISGALLMYHAIEDQNQGTAPMSSTRMMAALQGLGKPAALYMYPYEDHSVATYASDLDLWARWFAWFDVHVKNPQAGKRAVVPQP
ncbi:MAG TPA: prolyl oligopeptidase family serine peptidase [Gemmatimonas sp.]|nr:prolyl oligopeptidase family serine peptidase [Gemmatimonas sp.]